MLDRILSKAEIGLKISFLALLLMAIITLTSKPPTSARPIAISSPTGSSGKAEPTFPSPVPTFSATPSPTPSPTLTPTPTNTPTPSPTPSPTVSPTATPPPTPSPTATPSPTPSLIPTPAPTPDGLLREIRVPILMYHHIADPPHWADPMRRDLSLPPAQFEAHLKYLSQAGYQSIYLEDLIRHLAVGEPLPEKPIILTFDDGYDDAYREAYPLLKIYGFVGTFFIITDFVAEDEYLTWEEIKLMDEGGMEIGSHSHTHADLRGKTTDYIVWQVLRSKELIEAHTNGTVRFFCYPSGQYDELTMTILHQAHHWGAVTVNQGVNHSSERPFQLTRVRIRGSDTAEHLATRLKWWLGHP